MIRVVRLSKRLGAFALRNVSFEVAEGEYVVLLGPTASGKTVLLETLVGINRPDSGSVWLDDDDVTNQPPEKRGIGFVYQRSMLFPHLSVRHNIGYGLFYHRVPRRQWGSRIAGLAKLLAIEDILDRSIAALSGGESQKVALARALAIQPRVLLLDEPLAPLDPVSKESLRAQLAGLHRQTGTTIIHVTHDQETARVLGQRIGVMRDGRLLQFGDTDEVFGRPASAFVAEFVGMQNVFGGLAEDAEPLPRVKLGAAEVRADTELRGWVGVCVRPDLIHIGPGGGAPARPGESCVEGVLAESSDRGAVIRHQIATAQEQFVVLQTPKEHAAAGLAVGQPVRLTFGPEAVHVFPRTAEQARQIAEG